ncbi:hypothetical protein [Microvirga arabica]|uniref:hypothetical protein n=1 Tax=Microvirga arabica TaxID=1128671 RepID=UPI00193962EF|nr:hypothetical protein [Microvirga arabica]MBM1173004.1 hypothetical protein [Microvirga arabica]
MISYEDVTTHGRRSVLPPDLQRAVARLGEVSAELVDEEALSAFVLGLHQLPVDAYPQAAKEIHLKGRLYHQPGRKRTHFLSLVWPTKTESNLLRQHSLLKFFYLFHGSGYLREAALKALDGPLESPFLFTCVAYRLNDWVKEVRQEALACAERAFPQTSPDIVAKAAFILLARVRDWHRWSEEAVILEETFSRPDVMECLASLLVTAATGPVGKALTFALRHQEMDHYLLQIFQAAIQPSVRALALRTLIEGRALWPEGLRKEWIDKSMGRFKLAVAYGERPIARPASLDSLIVQGAADQAAMVRRVAADGLVRYRASLNEVDQLTQKFAVDRSASVRERAIFILKEREGKVTR